MVASMKIWHNSDFNWYADIIYLIKTVYAYSPSWYIHKQKIIIAIDTQKISNRCITLLNFQCSKSCGGGIQTRTAKCIDDSNTHIDDSYCKNSEMVTEQICNTENCPIWSLVDESPVSKEKYLIYFWNVWFYWIKHWKLYILI